MIKFKKRGQGKKSYRLYSAKKDKKSFRKYFKVKAQVKAAGDANYEPSVWKTATIRVKVR